MHCTLHAHSRLHRSPARITAPCIALVMMLFAGCVTEQSASPYCPTKDAWERKLPEEVGFDSERLADAITWAQTQATDTPADFSTQSEVFGRQLGPIPKSRAATNGIILRHGYIVAEFGDIEAVDPTYSVAKSYLSTLVGLTIDRGMIGSVSDPVQLVVNDGGYDSPQNSKVTWRHHVTQTSEWQGELFGKSTSFIGKDEYGQSEMKAREMNEPGTHYEYNDVRVNRLALSLLRLWKRPLPDVLKTEIMDPIGASKTWRYIPYDNAIVDVDGTQMASSSGGTRWGGGLWMSSLDHARFGLFISRSGNWNGQQLISREWIAQATSLQGVNPEYGYLWWLNTTGRWPAAPRSSFSAQGWGGNSIWIDPEHDLVVVWRWHAGGGAQAEFYERIVGALAHTDAK